MRPVKPQATLHDNQRTQPKNQLRPNAVIARSGATSQSLFWVIKEIAARTHPRAVTMTDHAVFNMNSAKNANGLAVKKRFDMPGRIGFSTAMCMKDTKKSGRLKTFM